MDRFVDWLRGCGISEPFLALYRQGADSIQSIAGAEQPVSSQHVDEAVRRAEAAGSSPRTVINLRKIGEALIEFYRAVAVTPPGEAPRPSRPPRASRPPGIPRPPDEKRRCVLVVESDPMISFDLEKELGEEFEVLWAHDLHEAWSFIDDRDADICVVVSDFLISGGAPTPGSATRKMFQRPKVLWGRVPTAVRIIISAKQEATDNQTITGVYAMVNAHAILPKPWESGALIIAVKRALANPVLPLPE